MSLFNKPLFKLFLTFWIIYASFANLSGWNENSRLDLTRAIVDEGTFKIDTYANNTGDRAYYNGHYYSDKFPGASFLAVPPYFVFKHVFGTPSINDNFYETNPDPLYNGMVFFVIIFTSALFSALTVVLVYKTAGFFTNKKSHKYIVAIAYGLGTIAFSQATLFMGHAIATFFSFAAFYFVFKMRKEKKDYLFFAGILGGFAIITEPLTFLIILGCFILVLLTKKLKNVLNFSIGCFLILLMLFGYNYAVFEDPLASSYNYVDIDFYSLSYKDLSISSCSFSSPVNENIFQKMKYRIFKNIPCRSSTLQYYSPELNAIVKETNDFSEESFLLLYEQNSAEGTFNYSIKRNTYFKNGIEQVMYSKIVLIGDVLFYNKNVTQYTVFVNKQLLPVNSRDWKKSADFYLDSNGILKYNYLFGTYSYTNCPWLNEYYYPFNISKLETSKCEEKFFYSFNGSLMLKKTIRANLTYIGNETLNINSENFNVYKFKNEFFLEPEYDYTVIIRNVVRLLFYPYRGLLFYSPILFVSIIGLCFMYRKYKFEAIMISLLFFLLLLFNAQQTLWWGGTSFGPRQLLPIIPFLIIPLLFSLKKINIKFILLIMMISVFVNLVGLEELEQKYVVVNEGISFEPELWNKLDSWQPIANPLFDHYAPLFANYGPRSELLEKMFGVKFIPFLNVLFLLLIIIFIFKINIRKSRVNKN
ncbi:MAG: glycosyltransferase family 39 protein [DPANN group archaeon]|nr:glycosyltransferase family 39 protein [DPANN group archaeon]